MISKKNISGAVVTVYALFIMLILSFIIIMMSQKTVAFIATRADSYLEQQSYWNAIAGRALAVRVNFEDLAEFGSDEGWDLGQIEIPASGDEAIGKTGRGGSMDIITTMDVDR